MKYKDVYKLLNDVLTNTKKNSADIIADACREYAKKKFEIDREQTLVAIFDQKYDHEDEWEHIITPAWIKLKTGQVIFEWDFCEGQTDVKNVKIYTLDFILNFFDDNYKGKLGYEYEVKED